MKNLFAAIVNQAIEDFTHPKGGPEVEENRDSARRFLFPELNENDLRAAEYTRHSNFIFEQLELDPVVARLNLAKRLSKHK